MLVCPFLNILFQSFDSTLTLLFHLLKLYQLFIVGLHDYLNFILLIMQILNLSYVVFLGIVKYLKQIFRLISNG